MSAKSLTVVYRGNFQPDQPEPWSTESQIAATLEMMGHRVVRAQEIGPQAWDWRRTEQACINEAADLFLWTTTYETDPTAAYHVLDELRASGIPSASYHLDLWWELRQPHPDGTAGRIVQLLDNPFFRTDFVFTADGGHQRQFRQNGINHHWAEPATFSKNAEVVERPPGQFPIVFIGSMPYPHPEHADARKRMIYWLQQRFAGKFRVYSSGYRNARLTALICGATIVIGDSCLAGRIPYYWSERIPETLGRGGFLIHPYVPGLEHSYTDGEHLRTYDAGDLGQLTALVEYYLAHAGEAKAIGAAGHAHVRERHLYEHRLADVLETVGLGQVFVQDLTPVGNGDA